MSVGAVDNLAKTMGFVRFVPYCESIRVTYAPAIRHARIGWFWPDLALIEESQDGSSVDGFIGSLSHTQYEQGLSRLNNCVDESMSRFA